MMPELRWILLFIGVAIVIAVYAYSRHQRHLKNEKEFSISTPQHDLIDQAVQTDRSEMPSVGLDDDAIELPDEPPVVAEEATQSDEPLLIVLHVQAADDRFWHGNDILDIALKAGLQKTNKQIFQYFHQSANTPIFHVANMLKPGTFDWDDMAQFKTRGLSLFMQLPTPCAAKESFLLMHACAQRLVNHLEGEILDQTRQPLSEAVVEEIHRSCDRFDKPAHSDG